MLVKVQISVPICLVLLLGYQTGGTLTLKPTISANYFVGDVRRIQMPHRGPGLEPFMRFGDNFKDIFVNGCWKGHIKFCTTKFKEIDPTSVATCGIGFIASINEPVATFKTGSTPFETMFDHQIP